MAAPSVASAAPCDVSADYTGSADISVSPSGVVPEGSDITVSGTGWPPGCDVAISVNGEVVGTVTTDANGNFSFGTTLGSAVRGSVTIGATAGGFTRTVTIQVGTGPAVTCNPTTLTFGNAISCTATGFPANVDVSFQINPALGTARSNAAGTATISTTLPAQSTFENGGCGAQTVTATGGGATASTAVTVTCPGTGTSGPLPRTGSDSGQLAGLALGLVAVGGLAVHLGRKRQQAAA